MLDYVRIDPDKIKSFDEHGFLIIRNAIDSEAISDAINAGDRLIASDHVHSRQTAEDGRYDGFRNCITMDDTYIPLLTHPYILPLVIHLLGANLQLMTSHLIYKSPELDGTPKTKRGPGWHRDYYQATADLGHFTIPRIELKCAYYLTDLSEPNSGVTMVAPGSNQLKTRLEIPENRVDPIGAIEPSLEPGDCLLFENRTWHAGAANLSDRIRKVIMIGYGYRWVTPMDFRKQEPEFLEKLNPLERYLVGESFADDVVFHFDGGPNPIKEWCDKHDVPAFRHLTE